jgi:hypothetical protein
MILCSCKILPLGDSVADHRDIDQTIHGGFGVRSESEDQVTLPGGAANIGFADSQGKKTAVNARRAAVVHDTLVNIVSTNPHGWILTSLLVAATRTCPVSSFGR